MPFSPTETSVPYARAVQDLQREHDFELLGLDGELPRELCGTVYRNGTTLFENQGERYAHLFDADGGLSAVHFGGGVARGAAKVLVSRELAEERAAERRLYGGYGSVQPGIVQRLRGTLKNTANTAVMFHDGALYAMMEGGPPTRVHKETLEVLGEDDLDGVLTGAFSAHPHAVVARGARYNFGVRYGRRSFLDLYELPFSARAKRLGSVELPGATFIHDFIATERYLVFFAPPIRLNALNFFLGRGGFSDNLLWRPEMGTEIIVVPIDEPSALTRFHVTGFYQWHFVNAFDEGGEIVVDFVRYDDFASNKSIGDMVRAGNELHVDGRLHRMLIDPVRKRAATLRLSERVCEFPQIDPRFAGALHRVTFAPFGDDVSSGPFHSIGRVEGLRGFVDGFRFDDGQYPGEGIFVPRSASAPEGDGWLICQVYDARVHKSFEAVFDARDLARGPLARAHFDQHIPPRFHGCFVDDKLGGAR